MGATPKKGPGGRPRGLTGEVTSVRLGAETVRRAHAIAAIKGMSLAVFLDGLIQEALREHEQDLVAKLTGRAIPRPKGSVIPRPKKRTPSRGGEEPR